MGKRTSSRRSSGRWLSKDSKEVKVFVSRGNYLKRDTALMWV
jgi:hypothetical protein